ncbi:hypothetical protein U0070_014613, partial [Myodes glareolus]
SWGASLAVTRGPHVTRGCRTTQPWVQSSLPSGHQLRASLRTAGWHRALGERSRSASRESQRRVQQRQLRGGLRGKG